MFDRVPYSRFAQGFLRVGARLSDTAYGTTLSKERHSSNGEIIIASSKIKKRGGTSNLKTPGAP